MSKPVEKDELHQRMKQIFGDGTHAEIAADLIKSESNKQVKQVLDELEAKVLVKPAPKLTTERLISYISAKRKELE